MGRFDFWRGAGRLGIRVENHPHVSLFGNIARRKGFRAKRGMALLLQQPLVRARPPFIGGEALLAACEGSFCPLAK